MLRKFLPLAAVTFTMFTAPAYASVVYDFAFVNNANGGGTVDGTVTLPSSADGTYVASSVVVTSNTAGFGLGEYVGNPMDNSFVISGGNITSFNFEDFGGNNSLPAVVCCSLLLGVSTIGNTVAGLTDLTEIVNTLPTQVTFAPTPIPAALPLFASGLGALGLLGWRRKRKQAVA